jgi:ATP-dependent Clp protease adaptor protein ClpS
MEELQLKSMTGQDKPPNIPRRIDDDGETGVVTKIRVRTKKPSMYKVLMLNDDYTPMEFVIYVLQNFFALPEEQAAQIMLHVHQRGVGVCGVYTYDIAETKVNQVMDLARENQHPLQCTIEKDGNDDGEL